MIMIYFEFGEIPKYYDRYSYLNFANNFINKFFKDVEIIETYYLNHKLYIMGVFK